MNFKILFTGVVGMLLAGCSKEAVPFGPSFVASDQSIGSYIDPQIAEASIVYRHGANGAAGDGQATYNDMEIRFYAGGFDPRVFVPALTQLITAGTDAQRYDSLTVVHQDYGYGYDPSLSASEVLYRGISAVDIVSDTDYDAQHPAGTSLADIFSLSLPEVVKGTVNGHPGYIFRLKDYAVASDLKDNGPHLSGRLFVLKPIKAPVIASKHIFKITYTDQRGQVLIARTKGFFIVK